MAQVFRDAGIPALAVSGTTPPAERAAALTALREREVNALFAADLFNEGLDLPDVDTVLLLRPTESATLFQQQLGRGLRRTRDKPVLTVLDFVGQHRREFRFDHRLAALTGLTRRGLQQAVERNFPFLPSGCQIVLDRQTQQVVLDNLRSQVGGRWPQLAAELRRYGDVDLATFLTESGLELADVVRSNRSWTALRRAAGLPTRSGGNAEDALLRRNRAFVHVDDRVRGASLPAAAGRRRSGLRRSQSAGAATSANAVLLALAGRRLAPIDRRRDGGAAEGAGGTRRARSGPGPGLRSGSPRHRRACPVGSRTCPCKSTVVISGRRCSPRWATPA